MEQTRDTFIKAENLTLKTPSGAVFENANFEVKRGEVCALFGSAGSGKTSLLLALGSRMKFSKGNATVAGLDLKHDQKKIRSISGVTVIHRINDLQDNLACGDILSSDLYLAGKKGNSKSVDAYLEKWNFSHNKKTEYFSLSIEEKIYFDVMLACTGDPELLLVNDIQESLTEHASFKMAELFKQLSASRGITTLFGTNEYEIAQKADSVVVMSVSAKQQREAVIAKNKDERQPRLAGWANYAEDDVDRHPSKLEMFKRKISNKS